MDASNNDKPPLSLAAIRARLSAKDGKHYWRSLNELAEDAEFDALLHREFPRQASQMDAVGRRTFLKLMGASLALAGVAGCGTPPEQHIVPYVKQPEQSVPGTALFFATATTLGGYATGALVRANEGRPTKVEGNPLHPASLGASDIFSQASILTLYDPDRAQNVLQNGRVSSWSQYHDAITQAMMAQSEKQGAGLRILTETVTSPTMAAQLDSLLRKYPQAKWHQYEPVNRDNARAGAILAFGEDVNCIYRFEHAEVILSLDADFLCGMPGSLRYTKEFSDKRRVRGQQAAMNRLYAVENTPSLTGAMADHRLALRSSQIEAFTGELARRLGLPNSGSASELPGTAPDFWMSALVKDLQAHKGASLVVAGASQPPAVHALAHSINQTLGNFGSTVVLTKPVEARSAGHTESLADLRADLESGVVDMLVILGGNPAYTAPVDFDFTNALMKARLRVNMGLYENETSVLCHWQIPQAHEFECWADARAFDGTATVMQPLIAPLYNGRAIVEVLACLLGNSNRLSYEIVRDYWRAQPEMSADFEHAWRRSLHDGIVAGSAFPPITPALKEARRSSAGTEPQRTVGGMELNFRPDPTIWDGRFANNGWLQELPKPLTKLTWDNVALISPASAEELNLQNEDLIELHYEGRSVRAPVWILPGHAAASITIHLGYGQTASGRIGRNLGFNAYALRTSKAPDFGSPLAIIKTRERYTLANTQDHHTLEGRDLVRSGTLEEYRANPEFMHREKPAGAEKSLYPGFSYPNHAWGMVIDQSACIGCSACTMACQSENNIPIVGKREVARGREMHWIRVDHYYSGTDLDNPRSSFQPVPCMHCENAPCEPVCPVAATTHSSEGLNDMVYNRCIGTRYCSNNCPYKVRRFNFLQYSDMESPSSRMRSNPEVTVREYGVMEKCTYCVQRINNVRIDAEKENRPIRDGEITPACAQACPSEAIIFGDINDKNSRVARLKAEPLNYGLLEELNTRPRTSYLGRLRNPNPEIEAHADSKGGA